MEKKYYTPEIEEFHVGFECEAYHTGKGNDYTPFYEKTVIHRTSSELLRENYYPELFRVKHLDREDIESFDLGIWSTSDECHRYSGNNRKRTLDLNYQYNGNIFLFHYPTEDMVEIYKSDDRNTAMNMPIISGNHLLFKGTIKNKSELKRILKQIGV